MSGILRHLIALRFIRSFWPFCFSLCEVFFSFILFTVCRHGASRLDFREMLPGVKFCHRAKQPHVKYEKALNIMKVVTHSTKKELKTGKKNCKKFH